MRLPMRLPSARPGPLAIALRDDVLLAQSPRERPTEVRMRDGDHANDRAAEDRLEVGRHRQTVSEALAHWKDGVPLPRSAITDRAEKSPAPFLVGVLRSHRSGTRCRSELHLDAERE